MVELWEVDDQLGFRQLGLIPWVNFFKYATFSFILVSETLPQRDKDCLLPTLSQPKELANALNVFFSSDI